MAIETLVLERMVVAGPSLTPVDLHRPRVHLADVWVDRLNFQTAVERIRGFANSGRPHQVVTVNLDFVSIAARNPGFRHTLNHADLAVADGMPLVWLSRLQGQPLPERVAGVELVSASCQIAAESNQGVFLLGAAPGVAERAAKRLERDHPGLRVVGTYSPPMQPLKRKQNEHMVRMVREAHPGFLFVALGAPRQDEWIRTHLHELNVPVAMGVGCVFDLLAGESSRAPDWMQRAGFEWAYRLLREPRRLWRRYLVNDLPLFARLLLRCIRQPALSAEAVSA
jgi:N-acetylglucosaminyldiphosphoundecaprenol N-acetyl-beta-D-mannosaminyltransferase